MKRLNMLTLAILACLVVASPAWAQFNRGTPNDWTTAQGNAQRTGWIRTDTYISAAAMKQGLFKLQWKASVAGPSSQTLHTGVGFGARFEPQATFSASGNNVYSYDANTGIIYWTRHFNVPAGSVGATCPAGLTDTGSMATDLSLPNYGAGRGNFGAGGAQSGYRSVTSAPGAALPTDELTRSRNFAALARRGAPARGAVGRGAAAPRRSFTGPRVFRQPPGFFVVASDGELHQLGTSSGVDVAQPLPFVPANADVAGLMDLNGAVYAATESNCGGAPNAIWAVAADGSAPVASWKTGGGSPAGFAFNPDGTLYAAVGTGRKADGGYADALVALNPKTLAVLGSFSAANADFTTAPAVLSAGKRTLVATATRDGRVYLVDAADLAHPGTVRAAYTSPAFSTSHSGFAPTGLASWQGPDGTVWVLEAFAGAAPAGLTAGSGSPPRQGGVLALKLTDAGDSVSLQPAWVSPNLDEPATPLIINNVVFAASRGSASTPARLYALDAATGAPLWNSGSEITSGAEPGTDPWMTSGQVYLVTRAHQLYAFGFPEGRYVNPEDATAGGGAPTGY